MDSTLTDFYDISKDKAHFLPCPDQLLEYFTEYLRGQADHYSMELKGNHKEQHRFKITLESNLEDLAFVV